MFPKITQSGMAKEISTTRKCCFVFSFILILCALASEFISKKYDSDATIVLARAMANQKDIASAKLFHNSLVAIGTRFRYAGIGLAVLGMAAWILSRQWKRKCLWAYMPMILETAYVIVLLLMIV